MATPAQIAANRRNAAKSTGPKTSRGKVTSSQNAQKHGLTAKIPEDEVRRLATIIGAEFPAEGAAEDDPIRALRLLQLAEAEARLQRVRQAERDILARGDAELRLTKELKMIRDMLCEDEEMWRRLTTKEIFIGINLALRVSKAGKANARRTYASLRRYLREAEAEQRAALRAWLAAG